MTAVESNGALTADVAAAAAAPQRVGVLRRLRRQPVTVACFVFILVVALAAVFAPLIAPYSPTETNVADRLQGPSGEHLLGTDELGRDVFSRIIYGGRLALAGAFGAVGVAVLIGVPIGLLAGYRSGWWDRLAMRSCDVVEAIPLLLVAFAVVAVLGRGAVTAMIAVVVVFAAQLMRVTRAITLSEREKPYVDAARVMGYGQPRILSRHLLVNLVGPLIVQTSILLGVAILIQAMLSFLGLGADVGVANWGSMLDDARKFQTSHPLMSIAPGVMIALTILAFNLVGDGVRDALAADPGARYRRARRRRFGARRRSSANGAVTTAAAEASVLSVENLWIEFPSPDGGRLTIVRDLSLRIEEGMVYGLVGESGAGKSMTALGILGLIPPPGLVTSGSIKLDGRPLENLSPRQWRSVRGSGVGLIFQDPMSSLSPVHTIGQQIGEGLRIHAGLSGRDVRNRAAELLDLVGVPGARERLDDYPHQFSGGMAQRAVIAAVLACQPRLLIADEPTTALDATIQKQVLQLLLELRSEFDMSVLLITHDLGVVGEVCDRVGVMYAGQLVEEAAVDAVFTHPRHPYTAALVAATPGQAGPVAHLHTIPGSVPPPWAWPEGCAFHPRCPHAVDRCRIPPVPWVSGARCVRADELDLRPVVSQEQAL